MNVTGRPTFSPEQRAELHRLGAIDAQIDELEANALPISLAWLRNPPTLQDVRDQLEAVFVAVECAAAAMSGLLRAGDAMTLAKREAQARILEACYEIHHDPHDEHDLVEKASYALSRVQAVVKHARDSLPNAQRRTGAASPRPVEWIYQSLVSGFTKGHRQPLPPYTLRVSSSQGSPFREIVGICYDAMGQRNTDPERAIKAFIKWRDEGTRAGRAKSGRVVVVGR
ncbi:MAG: hypothetical protein HY017_25065 [Betaproteobacteria bacterium]|nr:hypothetical protein [Betaproteobacteria bacterium]